MKDIVYKYDKALKEFTKRYISNSNAINNTILNEIAISCIRSVFQ